ncbi:MAG TPA: UDP-N-acetylmuramoyl-tripeptide--D-alanyl-D-alanine ligase [Gammaproteobacteria bacterium]|nr:UDP-N-acetylmuramoyl-tripeptide--D-alanyl-D-alanine ligase [Gammaproteobacteria bacterium]
MNQASDMKISANEFAAIMGGQWAPAPPDDWRFRGLCYSRARYRPGQVILGRADGFPYGLDISDLQGDMGRTGVILTRQSKWPPDAQMPVLRIDSIRPAIRRLAKHLRPRLETPIVAITGSVGKTSSCHLARHLLGRDGRVSTNGQDNYADGVFCETANLGIVDYLVIEACVQSLGEASEMLKPHVAVLTHISPAHMALHKDLADLAEKKAQLFTHMAPGGTAVINRDIPYFDRVLAIARERAGNVWTFGVHAESDLQLSGYDIARRTVRARIFGKEVEYELGMPGRHMAINSLGVLAACHALGVDWLPLLAHCATARPVVGRGGTVSWKVAGMRVSIIDDTWNANPASMEASFVSLANATPDYGGRRIAVLADMLELGDNSAAYHRQLVKPLLQAGVDKVYLAGDSMAHLWAELPGGLQGKWTREAADLLWPLVKDLRDGDVILLKGSHGTRLHRLVADLRSLTLAPRLGLSVSRAFSTCARRVEPHVPFPFKRWASWQLEKLIQRRTRSEETLASANDI